MVGDGFRQHRQHHIRKVDTGSPLTGFLIQLATHGDEVRYVCNVYVQQPVSILQFFERDRVVEVACIGWINGQDSELGQILAIRSDFFIKTFCLSPGILHDGFREVGRQIVLIDD